MKHHEPTNANRVILQGASYIPDQMNHVPESIGIPNSLRMCMDFLGDTFGSRRIEAHNTEWRLDETYMFFIGVSGEAFRHLGTLYSYTPTEIERVFQQIFHAAGYGYQLVMPEVNRQQGFAGACFADRDSLKGIIIEQIRDNGRPVILLEAGGWPDWRLIVGYDQGNDTLVGFGGEGAQTNHFPGSPENPQKEFVFSELVINEYGPWVLLVGEKQERVPLADIYRVALENGLALLRAQESHSKPAGFAEYDAWAKRLENDDDFPATEVDLLQQRYDDWYFKVSAELAERRAYGSAFMRQAIPHLLAAAEELRAAIACFNAEHDLVWQMWALTGGMGSPEGHLKLAEPGIRKQVREIIFQMRALDVEAAEHLEKALAKGE